MKILTTTITGNIVPTANYTAGSYTLSGFTVGANYHYSMGANDSSIAFSGGATFAKSAAASGVFTATATSCTLSGSGTSAITTVVAPILGMPLYASTFTPSLPVRQVTVGQFPAENPNFSRAITVNDEAVFVKRGTAGVAFLLADLINLALTDEQGLTWTPPVTLTTPTSQSCVQSSTSATFTFAAGSEYNLTYAWFELSPLSKSAATLTWSATEVAVAGSSLTSNNTNVSDGDAVTIGDKVYTFKTTLTPTEGEVLIGATADDSLQNLIYAINHAGTGYECAAANLTVSAGTLASHAFTVTPKALTTAGIYDVSTAGVLVVTPTDALLNGTSYYCTATDDAGNYGLTNGVLTTSTVTLTVT